MLVVRLPQLPAVSVLDGNTFESVIFCRFISLTGQSREFNQSQRQLLSMFNRSGQRTMGKYLKKAQSKGFIMKVRATKGLIPDAYARGIFFDNETQDSRRLIKLAKSLWGPKGLLRTWPYPTAWGHGCLPAAVILSLATLRLLDESISRKYLREYLSALVPQSSFNSGLKFLFEHRLVYGEGDRLLIAPDWDSKLERWLDTHPSCNKRQETGDLRRAIEIENNRMRVQKEILTDAEKKQVLALPCVVKGCRNKRRQLEHFPPRHFLKQFDVITNRHFVWSICRRHNREMADFIKSLDNTIPIPPVFLAKKRGVDPMRIYVAVANREIQRFYAAFKDNDPSVATRAIRKVLGLWKALQFFDESHQPPVQQTNLRKIRTKGKCAYSPHDSQLPLDPGTIVHTTKDHAPDEAELKLSRDNVRRFKSLFSC